MAYEKSAGAIIFRRENDIKFLLLYTKAHDHYRESWNFPKGINEEGESLEQTAVREITEETGITDINFIPGFKEKIHYIYRKGKELVIKDVYFFLAETKEGEINVSEEHDGSGWFDFEKAMKKIVFSNSRAILEKAREFILKDSGT